MREEWPVVYLPTQTSDMQSRVAVQLRESFDSREAIPMERFVLLGLLLSFTAAQVSASAGTKPASPLKRFCAAWVLNEESNNIRPWVSVPKPCFKYLKHYIEDGQYEEDLKVAYDAATTYIQSLEPTDGHDAVVFDIDETLVSTASFQATSGYGELPFDPKAFNDYVRTASSPPFPPALALWKKLRAAGWKLVLITGRAEELREATVSNLLAAGFSGWSELILKAPDDAGLTASLYKEKRRVQLEQTKGYKFRSCVGDQYSDCRGAAVGDRAFKLADPMYYSA